MDFDQCERARPSKVKSSSDKNLFFSGKEFKSFQVISQKLIQVLNGIFSSLALTKMCDTIPSPVSLVLNLFIHKYIDIIHLLNLDS